jgi:DNA-binding transcriptional ArsR family regulator
MRRDVYQAIADPVRRDIIGLLARETMTMNAVAENFDISRPAVSKHIRILHECGLVDFRKHGRERYCIIQPETLHEVASWIEQFRGLWETKLDSFEAYLDTLQQNKDQNE